jgi:hypothetical protein
MRGEDVPLVSGLIQKSRFFVIVLPMLMSLTLPHFARAETLPTRWDQVGWAVNLEGAAVAGVDVAELGSPSPVVPGFSERLIVIQMEDPDLGWSFWLDAKMVTRLIYALTPSIDELLENDRAFTRVLESTLPFSPLVAARVGALFSVGPLRLGAGPLFDVGFVGVVDPDGVERYELAVGSGLELHAAWALSRDLLLYATAGPSYHFAFGAGAFTTLRLRPELFFQYRFSDAVGIFSFIATPMLLALPASGALGGRSPYGFLRVGLGVVVGF